MGPGLTSMSRAALSVVLAGSGVLACNSILGQSRYEVVPYFVNRA